MSSWLWHWLRPQLPGWPPFSPKMWLWALLLVVCSMSMIFNRELWPHTRHSFYYAALGVLGAALALLLLAMRAFWDWKNARSGPWWIQAFQTCIAWGALAGLAVAAVAVGCWLGVVLCNGFTME